MENLKKKKGLTKTFSNSGSLNPLLCGNNRQLIQWEFKAQEDLTWLKNLPKKWPPKALKEVNQRTKTCLTITSFLK